MYHIHQIALAITSFEQNTQLNQWVFIYHHGSLVTNYIPHHHQLKYWNMRYEKSKPVMKSKSEQMTSV
jgi:hypothetical protein